MSTKTTGRRPVFFVATTGSPTSTVRREHCKITADIANQLGIPVNLPDPSQVRIGITQEDVDASSNPAYEDFAGSSASFTVEEIIAGIGRIEIYPNSGTGRRDGGIYKLFAGDLIPTDARITLWSSVPSSTRIDGAVTRHFDEPHPMGGKDFTEVVETGGADLCLFTPHGGNIELATSDQLAHTKSELLNLGLVPTIWDCRGRWGGGETFERWHVTSTDLRLASFPGLEFLMTSYLPFRYAVGLHGFSWERRDDDPSQYRRGIIIGGRASMSDKLAIRSAIEAELGISTLIAFYIADEVEGDQSFRGLDGDLTALGKSRRWRGTSVRNIANRLSPSGIHIEQSRGVRRNAIISEKVALGIAKGLDKLVAGAPSVWSLPAVAAML